LARGRIADVGHTGSSPDAGVLPPGTVAGSRFSVLALLGSPRDCERLSGWQRFGLSTPIQLTK
jgi:hypothetical protein